MGNSVSGSKDRHIDETVDFGYLSPQGVYTGAQDWNQQVVGHLIVDRKLAPFYRPLEEYDDSWDDEHILAARRGSPNTTLPPPPPESPTTIKFHHKNVSRTGKEPFRPTEASVYRGAVECPICFLYYPPNINHSRCCDQAICTECFVQIKRAEPTTTHIVSEPASCPYCVQENFGVTYAPPSWRAGLVRDGPSPTTPTRPDMHKLNSASSAESEGSKRRKSFGADSPEVVTIDQIRPDWEAKLAAVRAAVTRRANRRIIMRQVGDRLVPIGVSSGRMIDASDVADGAEGGNGRRRRRGHGGQDLNQILGSVGLGGIGGQDLEELMVMEAMRLSLMEHEEQQRRQNNNNNTTSSASGNTSTNGNTTSPTPSTSPSPRPSPTDTSIPILIPRSRSPSSARHNNASPRPTHSSLPLHHPLAQTPPPSIRIHDRRTGPSPDPLVFGSGGGEMAYSGNPWLDPTPTTGSAPLESAGVGAGTEATPGAPQRQLPALPRSTPPTRAASPNPNSGLPDVHAGDAPRTEVDDARGRGTERDALIASATPLVISTLGSGLGSDGAATSAAAAEAAARAEGDTTPSSRDPVNATSPGSGYEMLPSSIESSEPLLGWDK